MDMKEKLEKSIQMFRAGLITKDRMLACVFSTVQYFIPYYHLRVIDDSVNDSFALFLPKINALINRYDPKKGKFYPYLKKSFTQFYKNTYRYSAKRKVYDYIYLQRYDIVDYSEQNDRYGYIYENTELDCVVSDFPCIQKQDRDLEILRKRVLILTLKCAWYVDDELERTIAHFLGMSSKKLFTLVEEVKALDSDKTRRKELISKVRDVTYSRLCLAEQRQAILREEDLEQSNEEYEEQISSLRNRHLRINKRMKKVSQNASNKMVSVVLKMPCGSVDTSMYYIKRDKEFLPKIKKYCTI